jgi:hypothetical protein
MKAFLTKALILTFGLGLTMTFTACHTEGGTAAAPVVTKVNPTHSISGTILTADGKALNGAVVTINGTAVAVTGNTFAIAGLKDGTYNIEVKRSNYKTATSTETLAAKIVEGTNGEKTGMNIDRTFYLAEEVTSTQVAFSTSSTSSSDEITIETTSYTDGDGDKGNDTDASITVAAEIPEVSGDEYSTIEQSITEQGGTMDDFKVTLTNITSLEDAKAVARVNNVATSRMNRATTAMPNNNELLAGVAVNAGRYTVTMPANKPFVVTIKMPDDVKGAITLFHTISGNSWTRVDMNNPQIDGIKSIDTQTSGVVKILLSKVKTQSFGFGVVVEETQAGETEYEDIVAKTITNNTASTYSLSGMNYTVKSGVVLGDYSKSSLSDFLRKMMIRKYGTRLVKAAKLVEKVYEFSPAYSMHPYGVMHLEGMQFVNKIRFSVANSQAYYNVVEYGDWYVFPYEEWSEIEDVIVHGGGSN